MKSGSPEFGSVGSAFGIKTNTVPPAHQHTGSTSSNGDHNHSTSLSDGSNRVATVNAYGGERGSNGGTGNAALTINNAGAHTHVFTTDSTGSTLSGNNIQPTRAALLVIKT